MDNQTISAFWLLSEELSIIESAALVAGYDPGKVINYKENQSWLEDFNTIYPDFSPVEAQIERAVKSGRINAKIKYKKEKVLIPESDWEYTTIDTEDIDKERTLIDTQSLRQWLKHIGHIDCCLFAYKKQIPNYLDRTREEYAPKLAAAVYAWEAVSTDPIYKNNGKSVKQNIENWLTANAAEYELLNDDGSINKDAIKNQISKVANWQDKGGATKTPERKIKKA